MGLLDLLSFLCLLCQAGRGNVLGKIWNDQRSNLPHALERLSPVFCIVYDRNGLVGV
jgi:hypothetical protein